MAVIDISQPTPFEIERQGGFGSIRGLFDSIAQLEGIRRDRDILKRVTIAKAADPTASDVSILAGLAEPEISPGLQGIFQRIGGALPGGQGSILPQLQAGQIQSPLQRAQTEATRALVTQREAPTIKKPTAAANKKRLGALKKQFRIATDPAEVESILRETEDLENVTKTAREVFDDATYAEQVKKFKNLRVKIGTLDKANGKEVYAQSMRALLELALENEVLPSTVIHEFNAWWDKQVAKSTLGFKEFVDRKEFSPQAQPESPAGPQGVLTEQEQPEVFGGGEIPEPKTQAEFDAIPPGTEFIDTDGKRKRKQ